MKNRIKKRRVNPTRKDLGISIDEIYEMETGNYHDYTTDLPPVRENSENITVTDAKVPEL